MQPHLRTDKMKIERVDFEAQDEAGNITHAVANETPAEPVVDETLAGAVVDETPADPVVFELAHTFANRDEFDDFLKTENVWSKTNTVNTLHGIKTMFRCNKAKRRGKQCSASIYTIHDSEPNDQTITVFRKNHDHDHENVQNRSNHLSAEAKQKIIELYERKLPPKSILFDLHRDERHTQVTINQVYGCISAYKDKKYGKTNQTMAELQQFATEKMPIPDDEHEAFVLGFERYDENDVEVWFRFCCSTKRLLQTAAVAKNWHVDTTYKMVIQGFPVSVLGCTDMDRRFHLLGIMLSTNQRAQDFAFLFECINTNTIKIMDVHVTPEVFIADADPAISKAVKSVYQANNPTIIMCWFHVTFNAKKYALNNPNNRILIKADLDKLHQSYNEHLFEIGCRLFAKKWSVEEKEFVKRIEDVFMKKNRNWFNGAAFKAPKTNNALEQFNGKLKLHQTFYSKKNLSEFKFDLLTIVNDRSREYISAKDPFRNEVTISEDMMDAGVAYGEFQQNYIITPPNEDGSFKIYIRANSNEAELTTDMVEQFVEHNYATFEEFSNGTFEIHTMVFQKNPDDWKNAICSCVSFFQNYMCKHIIGIAYALKLFQIEPKVIDIVIEPNKKRGRPKKATSALQID